MKNTIKDSKIILNTSVLLIGLLSGCASNTTQQTTLRDLDSGRTVAEAPTGWSFDLMHTTPECAHPGKRSTFCVMDDRAAAAEKSGMEKRVSQIIDRAKDPSKSRIVIAYFSFSNKSVLEKLCEKGKAGFNIEGFFDNDYAGEDAFPAKLNQCQLDSAKPNVRVHFLGEKTDPGGPNMVWRLHHNKFLLVDPGEGSVSVNFSSGNLSSFGLSLHFDHWGVLEAPRESNLVQHQFCVVSALKTSLDPMGSGKDEALDKPDLYRTSLDSCLKKNAKFWSPYQTNWVYQALAAESIAPLFAPNPQNQIAKILMSEIDYVKSGGKIYGAIQHFLHPGIASAMQRAVKRGVTVQMIMDDDVILGDSEVPGVGEFYKKNLIPSVSGIDMRFMQTNSVDHQMMHNKFLVLEQPGGQKRVFSGAGHFTSSAMRNNYENFYLSQNDAFSMKYVGLFNYMWPNAMKPEEVKK